MRDELSLDHSEEVNTWPRSGGRRIGVAGVAADGGGRWRPILGTWPNRVAPEVVRQIPAYTRFNAKCGCEAALEVTSN